MIKSFIINLFLIVFLTGCVICPTPSYNYIHRDDILFKNQIQNKVFKKDSVLLIETHLQITSLDGSKRPAKVYGSSFVVHKDKNTYYVLTARHVIQNKPIFESAKTVKILIDGNKAIVVDKSESVDIAVLKFTSKKKYKPLNITTQCLVGQIAWLMGFAGGEKEHDFVIPGYVCHIARGMLYHNGGVIKGISGGPLLNQNDDVVGMANEFYVNGYTVYHCFVGCIPMPLIEPFLRRAIALDKLGVKLRDLIDPPPKTVPEPRDILLPTVKTRP